jgi:hypothetical protein
VAGGIGQSAEPRYGIPRVPGSNLGQAAYFSKQYHILTDSRFKDIQL